MAPFLFVPLPIGCSLVVYGLIIIRRLSSSFAFCYPAPLNKLVFVWAGLQGDSSSLLAPTPNNPLFELNEKPIFQKVCFLGGGFFQGIPKCRRTRFALFHKPSKKYPQDIVLSPAGRHTAYSIFSRQIPDFILPYSRSFFICVYRSFNGTFSHIEYDWGGRQTPLIVNSLNS